MLTASSQVLCLTPEGSMHHRCFFGLLLSLFVHHVLGIHYCDVRAFRIVGGCCCLALHLTSVRGCPGGT